MSLYRFGKAAVRLGAVVAIKEDRGEAKSPRVRVYFRGRTIASFDGEDAEAMIRFVAALPPPEDYFAGEVGAIDQPAG